LQVSWLQRWCQYCDDAGIKVKVEPMVLSSMTGRHPTLELDEQAVLAGIIALAKHTSSALSSEQIEDDTVAARTSIYEACQIPVRKDEVFAFVELVELVQMKAKLLSVRQTQSQLQEIVHLLDQHASPHSLQQQHMQLQQAMMAVVPSTVVGRHSTYKSLQKLEKYNLTVINHLKREVYDSSAAFTLLEKYVQLLSAAHTALKTFVSFMWQAVDHLPDGLHQHTSAVIKGLEDLTRQFVRSIHATADDVRLVHTFPTGFFTDAQQQFDTFMTQCGIRQEVQVANSLHVLFSQFEGDWGVPGAAPVAHEANLPAHEAPQMDPVAMRQSKFAEQLDKIKLTLGELLQKAHKLDVTPVRLLRSMHRMQAKLQLGSEQLSEYSLKQWRFDLSQLQQKMKEYEATLHMSDPLLSRVPCPELYNKDFSVPQAAWMVTDASADSFAEQASTQPSEVHVLKIKVLCLLSIVCVCQCPSVFVVSPALPSLLCC